METLNPDLPVKYRAFEQWENEAYLYDLHAGEEGYSYIVVTKDREPGIVWHRSVNGFDTLADLYDWLEERNAHFKG